jgi:hypothetical protein
MIVKKLDNKSITTQYDQNNNEIVGIILAYTSNQYITWQYTYFNTDQDPIDALPAASIIDTDKQNFYHGHYISNIVDASQDYKIRLKKLQTSL